MLMSQAQVAHAYNPSYSGGRDREDLLSKPAQASSSGDPISKKTHYKKRTGGVAQGIGPEFKPQYHTHTKKMLMKSLMKTVS
jgi:hypothetical protein